MKNDDGWMMMDEGWVMKDDDFKLLRGFASWQTDGQTNGRTLVIVESLSRLKIKRKRELTSYNSWYARFQLRFPCNSCMTLIHWWHPVKWLISSSSPPRSCHPLGIILVPRYSAEQPSQGWDGNNTKLCHASYYWVTASEGESPFEKPS